MAKIYCPNCGGEVSLKKGEICGVCEYCGNMVTSAPVTGDKDNPLLEQAQLFLTTGDFVSARKLCEEILDVDPENGLVYFYLMLAELQTTSEKKLMKIDFTSNKNYKLARFFGDDELNAQLDYYIEERLKMERVEAERREEMSRERRRKILNGGTIVGIILALGVIWRGVWINTPESNLIGLLIGVIIFAIIGWVNHEFKN